MTEAAPTPSDPFSSRSNNDASSPVEGRFVPPSDAAFAGEATFSGDPVFAEDAVFAGDPAVAPPVGAPAAPPNNPTDTPPSPSPAGQLRPPQSLANTANFAAYCRNASKIYGKGDTEVRALYDVSVGFETGRFTSIMGPSGSGKSTLMQCMAGLDTLTTGETYVGSVELSSLKDKQLTELRRSKIGFIFQAFNLIPTLSAKENITLPLDLAGTSPDEAWFQQVIETVGLADRMSHRPNELSGGQQQRVAVARALASRPDIIFGDEPTGNLDSKAGAEILSFMQGAVREFGQTIVMVTHDPISASYSDRVLFLADGEIVDEMQNPTADSVFDKMRHLGD